MINYSKYLLEKSTMVDSISDVTYAQIARIREIFLNIGGAGLAAPQVGIKKRIIFCSFNRDGHIQEMINPSYITISSKQTCCWEGCYSIPLTAAKIIRWDKIKAQYYNIDGKIIETELTGNAARIFQHECDHLDGILMTSKALEIKNFDSFSNLKKFLFSPYNIT